MPINEIIQVLKLSLSGNNQLYNWLAITYTA